MAHSEESSVSTSARGGGVTQLSDFMSGTYSQQSAYLQLTTKTMFCAGYLSILDRAP